ncbi:hypothetical protein ACQP1P_45605 [Dactylosporangium sp. CA-052675]
MTAVITPGKSFAEICRGRVPTDLGEDGDRHGDTEDAAEDPQHQ